MPDASNRRASVTLVRHATLIVDVLGIRVLVDPMLDPAGTRPPIANTANERRNPLVDLPFDPLPAIDAVLVTHLHQDHFDTTAALTLPTDVPVFCQPEDEQQLAEHGLHAVPVATRTVWRELPIVRTGGRHGHGETARLLAPVSGFVLGDLYVIGDSVWCSEVEQAIEENQPQVAIANAGAASFVDSRPITMDIGDVHEVLQRVPQVIAVHMEAINHCSLTRAELRKAEPTTVVPEDGETLEL